MRDVGGCRNRRAASRYRETKGRDEEGSYFQKEIVSTNMDFRNVRHQVEEHEKGGVSIRIHPLIAWLAVAYPTGWMRAAKSSELFTTTVSPVLITLRFFGYLDLTVTKP